MSIKIIKNSMTEPITVECENCKSIIEYTYEDIKRESNYNLFNILPSISRYIICPVCKSNIDIDKRGDSDE